MGRPAGSAQVRGSQAVTPTTPLGLKLDKNMKSTLGKKIWGPVNSVVGVSGPAFFTYDLILYR